MRRRSEEIEQRVLESGTQVKETKCTIRQLAELKGVSKSTSHKDLVERLPIIDYTLYLEVREILEQNKKEMHIRGGEATKQRWKKINWG